MIVCKVELWPGGDESKKRSLGVAYIVNDGTGTAERGNYRVMLSQMKDATKPWRVGRVFNWPRSGSPWDLLMRSCHAAMLNRRNTDHALRTAMVLAARMCTGGQVGMFAVEDDAEDYAEGQQDG